MHKEGVHAGRCMQGSVRMGAGAGVQAGAGVAWVPVWVYGCNARVLRRTLHPKLAIFIITYYYINVYMHFILFSPFL